MDSQLRERFETGSGRYDAHMQIRRGRGSEMVHVTAYSRGMVLVEYPQRAKVRVYGSNRFIRPWDWREMDDLLW